VTQVIVHPGVCGFDTFLQAVRSGGVVKLQIESECKAVKKLARILTEVSVEDVMERFNKNKVYRSAARYICHPSCPILCAIIKVVEAELGLALKKDVTIKFLSDPKVAPNKIKNKYYSSRFFQNSRSVR